MCLAKDPAKRPQSVAEVAHRLQLMPQQTQAGVGTAKAPATPATAPPLPSTSLIAALKRTKAWISEQASLVTALVLVPLVLAGLLWLAGRQKAAKQGNQPAPAQPAGPGLPQAALTPHAAVGQQRRLVIPELCGVGVRRTDTSILSPQPTAELGRYVTGLQEGKYVFNLGIDGTRAASLLGGFSRRFATTYDEIVGHFKNAQSVQFSEVVDFAAGILKNERIIDEYISKGDSRIPAILYLRAYQNLECAFPGDIMNNPPPANAILEQLRRAYPAFAINSADPTFKYIYNDAVKLAQQEVNKKGYISWFQILAILRQAILQAPR